MLCPNCKTNEAQIDKVYGVIPCLLCSNRQANFLTPKDTLEFTSQSIKNERREFAKDIVQSHRGGHLSREWLDLYGKNKALQRGFSESEIKHAKNVWQGDLPGMYYKDK